MLREIERPPGAEAFDASRPGGLASSQLNDDDPVGATVGADALTLAALPLGARLILRCRKDWRAAAVAACEPELGRVVLSVASPSGHTYRLRRPADSPLSLDGLIPVLGEGHWRALLARYDRRW